MRNTKCVADERLNNHSTGQSRMVIFYIIGKSSILWCKGKNLHNSTNRLKQNAF